MTGFLLTRTAIAAALDRLAEEMADAEGEVAQEIGLAGLKVLHTLLCCAEDTAADAAAWDAAEEEAEPEPEPEEEEEETLPAEPARPLAADAEAPPPLLPHRTPAREALLRSLWDDRSLTMKMILGRVNALPGKPFGSDVALHGWGRSLGLSLRRTRGPVAASPAAASAFPPAHFRPPATVPAAPAPIATEADLAEATRLVQQDPKLWGGRKLAEEFGWPMEYAAVVAATARAGDTPS